MLARFALLLAGLLSFASTTFARDPAATPPKSPGDELLVRYFRAETAALSARCLADIKTLDDWTSRRAEYRRHLAEMLGLWPEPARTDLKPVVTGHVDNPDFTVEKLHFQSRPGLYVTANLYLPKHVTGPAPAILYVCGHGTTTKGGVVYGNKAPYQHHGEWFARNGYVCLILDSLELGEINGIHHGLYRLGMWDWLSRGYTPAGVETWNGIRALDYLATRPEVDMKRVGVNGRSGGGAYSWYIAALDERIKVAIPVAGITDLQNHVVDGCIEGHCDCMYMVNTYRWDFAQVAALIAPRPLLISNSDKDTIFPLDGVVRLHSQVRRIYEFYNAKDKLGLLITEGPHKDTQDLRVPGLRWFNRFLKNEMGELKDATAAPMFQPELLKVFPPHEQPADAINMSVQDVFVPTAPPPQVRETKDAWEKQRDAWMAALKQKTFAGWPQTPPPLDIRRTHISDTDRFVGESYEFVSQDGVPLRLYVARPQGAGADAPVTLRLLDETTWPQWLEVVGEDFAEPDQAERRVSPADERRTAERRRMVPENGITIWMAPRGIGATAWTGDAKHRTHILRRFELLGQTLDGMRVWDVRRGIQAVRAVKGLATAPIHIRAGGRMAGVVLYASLFEPGIAGLDLTNLPTSHLDGEGPDLLNVVKSLDLTAAVAMAAERCDVRLPATAAWAYPRAVAAKLHWPAGRLDERPAHE